ncbi:MAG: amino acid ABC transporter permease [Tenericutes bacterium]|nr:amino acid ABC transporter permease [Mycoplasmatota bacterium]
MEKVADWFLSVIENFYQTVLYDGRYLLILNGLKNTLIMALGAVVLGLIIGGIISIIRYTNKTKNKFKILNNICRIYVTIIRGTPALLQLMIMYYIIFKTSSISSVIVGILAFGINSGAYCSEILRSGFESIDDGQLEAGVSLGLSYTQTLTYIIIPQAVKNSLPSIGNEFITLIKETAIAGYIGIVDLTRASDIIASRTYDYFFPLITIAAIYLFITAVLSALLRSLERKLDISDTSR